MYSIDNILMCGGFREEDGYVKTCEEMVRGSGTNFKRIGSNRFLGHIASDKEYYKIHDPKNQGEVSSEINGLAKFLTLFPRVKRSTAVRGGGGARKYLESLLKSSKKSGRVSQ